MMHLLVLISVRNFTQPVPDLSRHTQGRVSGLTLTSVGGWIQGGLALTRPSWWIKPPDRHPHLSSLQKKGSTLLSLLIYASVETMTLHPKPKNN